MSHTSSGYASDVSDEEWALIEPLLVNKGPGRPMRLSLRKVLDGIFYVLRTGCQWSYLPKEFPNYQSVYYHYRQWCWTGQWQWEEVTSTLRERLRQRVGRAAQPSALVIDSQSVKTTQVGGERGYDGGKKINGRKRHILVDTMGNLFKVVVHAANIQDRDGAKLVLDEVTDNQLERLDVLWADSAYDGDLADWMENEFTHWRLQLVHRPPNTTGFLLLPRRWVVERTFAWITRFRRLSRDYEKLLDHSTGMVYLTEIRRLLKHLALAK